MLIEIILFLLIVGFFAYRWAYDIPPSIQKLQGFKSYPIVGSVPLFDFENPVLGWVNAAVKNKWKIWKLTIINKYVIIISDAILFKDVTNDQETFVREKFFEDHIHILDGKLLFAIDGEEWKYRRTTLNPLFSKKSIDNHLEKISHFSQIAMNEALRLKSFNATDLFIKTTLSIILTFIFGEDFDILTNDEHQISDTYHVMGAELMKMNQIPLYRYLPKSFKKEYHEKRDKLQNFVHTMIDKYRKRVRENAEEQSMFDLILDNYKDNKMIVDEVKGILAAGHETTGNTLGFIFYELLRNPEILEEVLEEVDKVLPNGKVENVDQVKQLVKLEACIKETQRLYAAAGSHPLTATKDTEIDGVFIPKGSPIFALTQYVLRSPDYWNKADQFFPQRFWDKDYVEKELPEGVTREMVNIPFLRGRHTCIGIHLARLEMVVVVATFLKNLKLEIEDIKKFKIAQRFTLEPLNFILRASKRN